MLGPLHDRVIVRCLEEGELLGVCSDLVLPEYSGNQEAEEVQADHRGGEDRLRPHT